MTSRVFIDIPSESAQGVATRVPSIARRGLRLLVLGWSALALLTLSAPAQAQPPVQNVDDALVHEVASQLRCVVCQNLSVADSPSEMAHQMRAIVRERLAAGERPEQVIQYFVDKYGDWILLAPRRRGFTLLVWLAPAVAVAIGLALFGVMVRRWTRHGRAHAASAAPVVDPAMRERIRKELELEGDR